MSFGKKSEKKCIALDAHVQLARISRSALRKVGKTWQSYQNEITLDITRIKTAYVHKNYN